MRTIAIIGCGAMGAAVAARLVENGATVLTSLAGRGEASRTRALAAGMQDVSPAEMAKADIVLSIVPPSEAGEVAKRWVADCGTDISPPYVDCNAVGVPTMKDIAEALSATGAKPVDCAIIGFPPKPGAPGPTFHFSGPDAAHLLWLGELGLKVKLMDAPVGAASAFKLSYAGITKGLVAVASAMILAAEREGAGAALAAELADSQPQLLARFRTTLPDMFGKAGRWVDEMHSIAGFVGKDHPESAIYEGAAGLYETIHRDGMGNKTKISLVEAFLSRN